MLRARLGVPGTHDPAIPSPCHPPHQFLDAQGRFAQRRTEAMNAVSGQDGRYEFEGRVICETTGRWGLQIRVVPYHDHLASKHAMGLAVWG